MKRSIIIINLCTLALSASAQFKILSSGNTYITCDTGGKSGMDLSATNYNSNSTVTGGKFTVVATTKAIGLQGNAISATTNAGVYGTASYGTKSIGVLGSIPQSNVSTGAAVYGTIFNDMGTGLSTGDKYAGFFRGNVKATGSIVAGSTIQGAFLGESASSTNSSEGGQSLRGISVASSLSGLNVTTYQKERPAMPVEEETIFDPDGDSSKVMETPEPDIMDEQFYTKSHYALDADKLEEVFPDLVYVNKDGSKVINYVEMIPLLVQSINELNEKIEVLQGQSSGRAKAAVRGTTGIDGSSISQNKLYQNTPNPFKGKTTIHFTLADDAKDAYICIFDMTGKPVKKLPISSGMDSVSFGGYEIGEGMFLYSLVVNGQEIDTKRMIIRK
jgi:hypothetical protein